MRKPNSTRIQDDPAHHLAGPFTPQTPLGSSTPESLDTPVAISANGFHKTAPRPSTFIRDILTLRWAVEPYLALKMLLVPVVLYINWELMAPFVAQGLSNPFAPLLFLSYRVPTSTPDDPRYAKGYLDFVFIAYHIVFFSFVRQFITVIVCTPIAKYFGIKKRAKIARFGEQGYAFLYFSVFGAWGVRIMSQLPTWWYRTEYMWIDYPHWQMIPELKRYYVMQLSYWCQQLIVLLLGLEKPRKDYKELVAHHIVTLWLIGWSYLINLTYIGNAIYMSMDIPDIFLAFSKLLNYMQWDRAKTVAFGFFVLVWTYFRHWLNIVILWSVYSHRDLVPEHARRWAPSEGCWYPKWIRDQALLGIGALQVLNLFWYFLILRILVRALATSNPTDERSDDEDEDETTAKKVD